jgi:hypothetical protein
MAAAKPAASKSEYWQSRHFDSQCGWGEWETIKPTGSYVGQTVETMLDEYRAYIACGNKYELRPLYTAPPSPDAELVELLKRAAWTIRRSPSCQSALIPKCACEKCVLSSIDAKLASLRKEEP